MYRYLEYRVEKMIPHNDISLTERRFQMHLAQMSIQTQAHTNVSPEH